MNHISTYASTSDLSLDNLDTTQTDAIAAIHDQFARLNDAITRAVDAGLEVEVTRARRYHAINCVWGDQVAPRIARTNTQLG